MSFKTSKGKRKTEHEFADEVKSMLRPKGEVTYAPVEFLNAPALLHFGATNNELEGESGDSVAHYSSKDSTGSSSKKKSSARSSSSTGSLGCTWASLPGKKLKLDANPLAVQARDGGGIDDATCLEVEEIDASIYLTNLRGPPPADGSAAEELSESKAEKKKTSGSKIKEPASKATSSASSSGKKGSSSKKDDATSKNGEADSTTTTGGAASAATGAATAATAAAEEAKRHCAVEVHEATKDMAVLKQRRKSGLLDPAEFESAKKDLLRRMEAARKKVKAAEAKAKKAQDLATNAATAGGAGGLKGGDKSKKDKGKDKAKGSQVKASESTNDEEGGEEKDDDDSKAGADSSASTAEAVAATNKKKKKQEKEKRRLEALKRKKQRRKEEEEEEDDEAQQQQGSAFTAATAEGGEGGALVLKKEEKGSSLSTSSLALSSTPSPMTCPAAWLFLGLDPLLGAAMARLGFEKGPTPVQAAVLPRALGTVGASPRDVVGAAQTGSGKTLAYGLPIVDWLLRRHKISGDAVDEGVENGTIEKTDSTAAAITTTTKASAVVKGARDGRALVALVLCPTRELALQVSDHLTRLVDPPTLAALGRACDTGSSSSNSGGGKEGGQGGYKLVCTLVGGLSEQKQIRLLDRRPPIVVATPGRCWEMLAEVGHAHLQAGLRFLRFLVVDEADRMVQAGSFEHLTKILEYVTSNSSTGSRHSNGEDGQDEKAIAKQLRAAAFLASKQEEQEGDDNDEDEDISDSEEGSELEDEDDDDDDEDEDSEDDEEDDDDDDVEALALLDAEKLFAKMQRKDDDEDDEELEDGDDDDEEEEEEGDNNENQDDDDSRVVSTQSTKSLSALSSMIQASTSKPGRSALALDLDAGEAPLMTLEEAMKAHQEGISADGGDDSGSDGGSDDDDGDDSDNAGENTITGSSNSTDNAAIEATYAAELKRAEKLARAEALAEKKKHRNSAAAKDGDSGSKKVLGDRKISKRVRKVDGRGDAPHGRFVDAVLSVDDVMQMGHDDFNQDEDDKDNNIGDNHGLGSSFQGFGEPRQAFVFSATLTLPDEDRKLVVFNRKQLKQQLKAKNKGGKGGKGGHKDDPHENNALLRIMHQIGVRGEPFVCDLTSSWTSSSKEITNGTNGSAAAESSLASSSVDSSGVKGGGGLSLPSGLSVFFAEVMQRSKDAYLYHFLLLSQERRRHAAESLLRGMHSLQDSSSSGGLLGDGTKTVVFVNAIATARRVSATLELLGIAAKPLHAEMQQRQRLKTMDHFKASPNAVLVATDVAARGLDVKGIGAVVHYDLPRTADAFVHRSGRTARAGAKGVTIAFVSQSDSTAFAATLKTVYGEQGAAAVFLAKKKKVPTPSTTVGGNGDNSALSANASNLPRPFVDDLVLLKCAEERAHLASKLVAKSDDLRRANASDNWFRSQAAAMELEVDELVEENEMSSGAGTQLQRRAGNPKKGQGGGDGSSIARELAKLRSDLLSKLAEDPRGRPPPKPRNKRATGRLSPKAQTSVKNKSGNKRKR